MKISVIIPTIKKMEDVVSMVENMQDMAYNQLEIIIIAKQQSAAKNQNEGLKKAKGEYIVICGDDVENFSENWDKELINAMETTGASMVMPRLYNKNGTVQALNHGNFALSPDYIKVRTIPSAICMFKNTPLRFDENFLGSGYEDTDFCNRLGGSFYIVNSARMIHRNEKKNQFNAQNKAYYEMKWGKS